MDLKSLVQAVVGERKDVKTRRGTVPVRSGGIFKALPSPMALGGAVMSPDGEVDEATAIHEQYGHNEGRGAGYDWKEYLGGYRPGKYGSTKFTEPSEIYAYTTQPAELSYDDMVNFANLIKANPEFEQHFNRYKNPQSDWDLSQRDQYRPKPTGPNMQDPAMLEFLAKQKLLGGLR